MKKIPTNFLKIVIKDLEFPLRLDKYLKNSFEFLNQALIQKLIRKKTILINNNLATSSLRVNNDDVLELRFDLDKIKESFQNNTSLNYLQKNQAPKTIINDKYKKIFKEAIIWEDKDLLVVNKPQEIASQGGTGIKISMDVLAKDYFPQAKIAHRIDKNTSGILIFAKNLKTAHYLTEYFANSDIKKTYLALVEGDLEITQGIIDVPIKKQLVGKKEIMITPQSDEELKNYKSKFFKAAQTQYTLKKKFNKQYCLIECFPKTGRTHQLRVHLSYIGNPIVGDYKYGAKEKNKKLHLHAYKLDFKHPDGGRMSFCAPLSKTFLETFKQFKFKDFGNLD